MSDRPLRALQFIEGGARYGAAASLMNTAEGMRSRNVDVEFAVFAGKPLGSGLRDAGFTVHEIPARRRYDLRGARALANLLTSGHFDVLHTHLSKATVIGTMATRFTRTPLVATVHGMNKKFTYMFADHVMAVSEAAKQYLVDQGIPASRITAVYNCIPLEPFESMPNRGDAKGDYGFGPGAFVLGTIARAHKMKGIELAIEAVAELRKRGVDAKYLFVGDGPDLGEFQTLAGTLGIAEHVAFPGYSESIVEPLGAMDGYLFPTYREAFGISLLEAMAARVPVIASAVDGVPEVLGRDAGILIQDHEATAFADAAERLHSDAALRDDLVRQARTRVETVFSVEQTAKMVETVYRSAIQSTRGRARKRQSQPDYS